MAHMHATEIGRELPPPIADAPNAIAEISATLLRAQSFTGANGVALTVRESGSLVCRATNGVGAPEFGAFMPLEGSFLGVCLATKRPQKCDDTDTDLRFENACYSRVRPKSVLAVPVRSGNDCLAVLAVYSNSTGAFTNTHIAILRTMGDSLARSVQALPALEPPNPPVPALPAPPSVAVPPKPAPEGKPAPVQAVPEVPPRTFRPELVVPEPVKAVPVVPPPASQLTATPVKKQDNDLLVLASDPGPMQVSEPPVAVRPQITAPPRIFTAQTTYGLPRPLPRSSRRRTKRIRMSMVVAAVLVSAIGAAGWRFTRSGAPHVVASAAAAPVPVVAPQPAAPMAVVPAPATPAQVPAAVVETVAAPQKSEVIPVEPAGKTPVVDHAPAMPVKTLASAPKPLPTRTAEVEAPTLAMNIAPALPVVAAPVAAVPAPVPALRHSEVVPAKVLERISPQYPAAALRMRISGKVVLSATIRKDGAVGDVKMLSGSAFLRDSAISAVKQWRYKPALLDGSPVDSVAEIILNFTAPR